MIESRDSLLRVALIGALLSSPVAVPVALAQEGVQTIEEVVVVGSRRAGRTATDSPVPVDVVTGEDFQNQGTSDMDELLRTLLPSYNVSNNSIDDAATITRPANLRGLPPDDTLILINGKRHHRASVIAELGGSLSAGSQGPDVSTIPTLALERVEVLRDGASAQYGSDAIAGVINFVTKSASSGLTLDGKYGEFYEGDGQSKQLGANWGLPLGPDGFANVTLQWKDKDATSRSLQKTNAVNQIALGNDDIIDPVQVWGSPEVKDDWAFFVNSGIDLTDQQHLYGFFNYAERKVTGGFFYRNPEGRPGVFTEDFSRSNRLIFDTDLVGQSGQISTCPVLLAAGRGLGDSPDLAAQQVVVDDSNASIAALPDNCWLGNFRFPGGYTPQFGGDVEDISAVVGIRGEMDNGLSYDFSASMGRNESAYRISNTWNPSLGPEGADINRFNLGKYRQTEQSYNADFAYPLAVDAFYSDLNVAFGAEYRVETFQIEIGDIPSWETGPYTFQGDNFHCLTETVQVGDRMITQCAAVQPPTTDGLVPLLSPVVGAHGFAGFSPEQAGEWDRANWAVYTDFEADVIESLTLGAAARYEDFDDFGSTLNGKLAARWQIVPSFAVRGSYSTGFRAPTPGQSNVTKISTVTVDGAAGLVWDATDNLTMTLDWYRIELKDRIAQTGTIDITAEPVPPGISGCEDVSFLNQCLERLGIPGASTLSSVSFFTNDFETTTQGVDLVATYVADLGNAGVSNFSIAWNYTKTTVDDAGEEVARDRVLELEHYNPRNRGTFTWNHLIGDFRVLLRASYYDDWTVGNWSSDPTDPGPDGTGYT
ncbi:MAG: TonB-dependent receptor, partial [Gammaproteobacteria bacterium]